MKQVHAEDLLDLPHRHRRPDRASSRWPASGRRTRSSPAPTARRHGGYQVVHGRGHHRRLHDRRLHDPLRLPHLLRRAPRRGGRPAPRAARVGPAHRRAAVHPRPAWPSSPASSTCPTPACSRGCPTAIALRFEHFVRADGRVLPRRCPPRARRVQHRRSRSVSTARRRCSASALAYALVLQGPRARTASPSATRLARAGHTVLVNKYYLDHLYTDIIAGGIKGPIARAAYWFNQNVIDGVVNGAGTAGRAGRQVRLRQDRPGRRRHHRQRLRRRRRGQRPGPAPSPDRQGAAVRRLLFAGAGDPGRHLRASSSDGTTKGTHREGPAQPLGPERSSCSCRWWARR